MPGTTGLTRRGRTLVALVVVAVVGLVGYGTQPLAAVVVPGLLVLGAGYWRVTRSEAPTADRVLPEGDVEGSEAAVTVSFDGDGRTVGVATDPVGDGLTARGNERQPVHGSGSFQYGLEYDHRGVHDVGPMEFELRDVLGLIRRPTTADDAEELVVYPRTEPLPRSVRVALSAFSGVVDPNQREEFDHLREYERGDALRDVNWKSSARQPSDDLIVEELSGSGDSREGEVLIATAAETESGADDVAVAAASVAVHLLSEGVAVGVLTPRDQREPDAGIGQRTAVLEALGRFHPGSLPEGAVHRADVIVQERGGNTIVRVHDRAHNFAVGGPHTTAEVNS